MAERWLPVVRYEGVYEVSDLGRVRSYARGAPRILKQWAYPTGHRYVGLQGDGRRRNRTVHSLLMEAFVGPRPPGHEVRHRDGDPANNTWPANIEYAPKGINHQDRKWHKGTALYKLTPDDVVVIRLYTGIHGAGRALARQFGVSPSTISKVQKFAWHKDVAA